MIMFYRCRSAILSDCLKVAVNKQLAARVCYVIIMRILHIVEETMRKREAALERLVQKRKTVRKRKLQEYLNDRNEKLREKLIEERHLTAMTQGEVARLFGRNQSFISRIEN